MLSTTGMSSRTDLLVKNSHWLLCGAFPRRDRVSVEGNNRHHSVIFPILNPIERHHRHMRDVREHVAKANLLQPYHLVTTD